MGKIVSNPRRDRAVANFYNPILDELKIKAPKNKFLVKDVFNHIESIKHLSDTYAYDVLVSVLVTAVERNDINKIGKFYFMKA
jgi:hypothetical protein